MQKKKIGGGGKKEKKQDESEDEGCKHVAKQMFFLVKVKLMKNEEDERVLKHKKLDEEIG
jgi:hypothetical protein